MKKLFVLLMAAVMLLSVCAFAEEAVEEAAPLETTDPQEVAEAVAEQDVLNFDITMDQIPEGYDMIIDEAGGLKYAVFTSEAEGSAKYIASVGYSSYMKGFTLNAELTDEQMAEAVAGLTESYNNAEVTMVETTHGTKALFIDEHDTESDYSELVTIYDGYIINIFYYKDTELTAEDDALALQILSDLWVK